MHVVTRRIAAATALLATPALIALGTPEHHRHQNHR